MSVKAVHMCIYLLFYGHLFGVKLGASYLILSCLILSYYRFRYHGLSAGVHLRAAMTAAIYRKVSNGGWMDGWWDGWMDGGADGWMDGWMEGLMDG